jgi:hypothetical protein
MHLSSASRAYQVQLASEGGGTFEQLPADAKAVVHSVWRMCAGRASPLLRKKATDKQADWHRLSTIRHHFSWQVTPESGSVSAI